MKLAEISFVHNYNKHLSKKGEAAIHLKIYLNTKRKLIKTGIYVKPGEWDPIKEQVKSRGDKDILNVRLREIKRTYEDQQDALFKKNKVITIASICSLQNPEHGTESFIDFCKAEIEERAEIRASTKKNHRTYLNRLTEFKKEIYFGDIDYTLLDGYEKFLLNYQYEINEVKHTISKTMALNYLKFFSTYLNIAIKKDLFEEYLSPFRKFNWTRYKTAERQAALNRTVLEYEEVQRIEALTFKGDLKHLNEIKEFFLFQCYTGLAYNDMTRLKNSHINHEVSINGKGYYIQLSRGKTNEPLYIPVHLLGAEANRILTKKMKRTGRYLFDTFSVQYIDRELKRIAAAARIDKNLTSHVGRHSAAMFLRRNNIPSDTIQRILGHANIKTTLIYARIDKNIIRAELKKANFQ